MPETNRLTAIVVVSEAYTDLELWLLENKLLSYVWHLLEASYEVKFLIAGDTDSTQHKLLGKFVPVLSLLPISPPASTGPMSPVMLQARRVYETLKQLPQPQKIISNNRDGLLYYVACSQRQGLQFQNTSCEVVVSQPADLIGEYEGTFHTGYRKTIESWMEKTTAELVNQVICHSSTVREWMLKDHNTNIDLINTYKLPNLFSFNKTSDNLQSEHKPELVFIGGMSRSNGLLHLIRALTKYNSTKPEFTLTFIGSRDVPGTLKLPLDEFLQNTQIDCRFIRKFNNSESLYEFLNHPHRIMVALPVTCSCT